MSVLPPRGAGKGIASNSHKGRKNIGGANELTSDGPRSLQRTLGIFTVVARSPDGLSLAQISSQLKSPKSSLLTLLRPLVAANYLAHSNSRYTLGNESFVFATNIISARKLSSVMRGLMAELQQQCPETIILAVMNRTTQTVMYMDVLESPQTVRYSVPIGTTRPLFMSAAGRLLLAYQNEGPRDEYLRRVSTRQSIANDDQFRKKLNSIRRAGLSVSVSETVDGATGVAAPIFGSDGAILAALLIAGPTERYIREGQSWVDFARDFAFRASRAIGFSSYESRAG